MKINELLENITSPELTQVEEFAQALWNKLGIDIKFTHHFIDRLNDERNGKPISVGELIRLFRKEYQQNGKAIAGIDNGEAVMKDLATTINLPFVVKDTSAGKELIVKTIMRKSKFLTRNPEYIVR